VSYCRRSCPDMDLVDRHLAGSPPAAVSGFALLIQCQTPHAAPERGPSPGESRAAAGFRGSISGPATAVPCFVSDVQSRAAGHSAGQRACIFSTVAASQWHCVVMRRAPEGYSRIFRARQPHSASDDLAAFTSNLAVMRTVTRPPPEYALDPAMASYSCIAWHIFDCKMGGLLHCRESKP